jgi:fatty acid desaturase
MSFLFLKSFFHKIPRADCANFLEGFFVIFINFLVIFFISYLYQILDLKNSFYAFLYIFSAAFLIGSRMRALGNIIHECAHATFVPSFSANIWIGRFLSMLEFGCFDNYQREHFSHHRYIGDFQKDLDFKTRQRFGVFHKEGFRLKKILRVLFSPQNYFLMLKNSLRLKCKNRKIHKIRYFYLLFLACLVVVIGPKLFFFFIVFPFLTTYQMVKIFSDIADHGGLYLRQRREFKIRNHYFSFRPLNWFFFPRNDAYHLVHHLYPSLPSRELPKKHKELLKKEIFYRRRRHCIF